MSSDPILFDTHVHIDAAADTQALLQRAGRAGVGWIVVVAADRADALRAVRLAAAEPRVRATVGLHPHVAADFDGDLEPYREIARDPGAVAVGEIGLDYYYEHSPRRTQCRVFEAFLQLAAESTLPAVIHCRDAFADCLDLLRANLRSGQQFEIHSFTGTPAQAETVLSLGGFLSFNGMVTFRKADNIRNALAVVPAERLLLETDSPYLTPVPHRGKPNEPAYLTHIARAVAALRGRDYAEIAACTTANGKAFFGIRA